MEEIKIIKPYTNQLQEYIQKQIKITFIDKTLEYRTCLIPSGKEYITTITLHTMINNITGPLENGIDKNKNESKQKAAKKALQKLKDNEKVCPHCKQSILLN